MMGLILEEKSEQRVTQLATGESALELGKLAVQYMFLPPTVLLQGSSFSLLP